MKNIIIVGAGGFGREILSYTKTCINAGAKWQVKGFIDDNLDALKNYNCSAKILCKISEYTPSENDFLIIAIGKPQIKKQVIESLKTKGAKFESLIHPSAIIGESVELGEGVVICPFVSIPCDAKIGNFTIINTLTTIGHDASIGAYTTLSAHCDVTGFVNLGEGVFFASSVTTVPSANIGDWTSVGINSFVIKNVKPSTSVFGNPALPL